MENTNVKKWEQIDFAVYLRFALPWAILAVAVEIIFRLMAQRMGSGFLFDFREYISWAIRIIFIVFIGWRKLLAFGPNTGIGAISGIIAGSVIGFLCSFFLLFQSFKVWKIFNIFSETVLWAVIGAVILVFISHFIKLKIKK
ncbi:MAG: hypothetical protein WCV92_00065 [Candidatus Buchananbacteria bacterium]|jgi:uncharacterized membrane protein YeaQ/YmgE (transglycosylase-associated protein family)